LGRTFARRKVTELLKEEGEEGRLLVEEKGVRKPKSNPKSNQLGKPI
jgi:hypothetical protein